jgi:multidrug efflux pump subunit AcrA (membrane-fusion protein)
VDVGNKKNDLIDAMYQLHLDRQILNKAEAHADAVPEVFLWNAQRQVQGDQNNVNRALATLRSWGISDEDIKLVQNEAEEVIKRGGKHNPGVDVKGHIDNPKEVLRAGQFISATVELPPPADVVEVPIDAVSEDGQQAVVFVLTDPAKHHYTMRRVQLEARFEETAFVRSKSFDKSVQPTKEEEQQGILPKEPLRPGELILQTGVGELKAKLLDLESQPEKK